MKYLLSILLLLPSPALAHGGGLNAEGCHTNRKTGIAHCHRGGDKSSSFALISQAVTLVSVEDGDTIRVRTQSQEVLSIRLACIDAPESRQEYGDQSTERLKKLVSQGSLSIRVKTSDRYGRTVAEVFSAKENLNLRMVKDGAAWAYRRYLKSCDASAYKAAEADSKKKRQGLWAGGVQIAPWDYRRSR